MNWEEREERFPQFPFVKNPSGTRQECVGKEIREGLAASY